MAKKAPTKEQTKTAMSITKCSSKILESISYKEASNDVIHGQRWREIIGEEL